MFRLLRHLAAVLFPRTPTVPTQSEPPEPADWDDSAPGEDASAPGALTEEEALDARGERAFAARLYGALGKDTPGNLFFSPASARFALAMVLAGARGETERELAALLGATPATHDVAGQLADAWAELDVRPDGQGGDEDPVITLRTANRLFGQASHPFAEAFVDLTRRWYKAPIEAVDFQGDAAGARATINAWVEAQTAGRIRDLVANDPPQETKLVLANALYFKAAWAQPFLEHDTRPEPFFAPGGPVTVPTMQQEHFLAYADTPNAQVVALPYAGKSDGDLAMVLVVPKHVDGLAALERGLDADQVQRWARAPARRRLVRLWLPRFRVESALSLGETLARLGAPSVFQYGKADLSGIDGTRELFLGLVLQKTFVEVNEQGTEAAAATLSMMEAGGMPEEVPRPVDVRADRPFLFLIRDVVRDRTLFVGRLVSPAKG